MILSDMMDKYPDELTCDMAETYGVFNIKALPARLAATLAVGLRDTSRVKMALTSTKAPNDTFLLALIADTVRWIQWAHTEDGQKGVNRPPLITDILREKEPEEEEKDFDVYETSEDFRAAWERITGRDLRGNVLEDNK